MSGADREVFEVVGCHSETHSIALEMVHREQQGSTLTPKEVQPRFANAELVGGS